MEDPFVDCWEAVYLRHRSGLFSLALSILGQRQAAEDAVHEAFVSLCRCNEMPLDPDAYVFRTVRNSCIDLMRKNHRDHRLQESLFQIIEHQNAEEPCPSDQAIQKEREGLVRSAIDSLSPSNKEVVVLKQFAGLTFHQIGEVLEIPMKTAATRYRRVLMQLKEELEGKL